MQAKTERFELRLDEDVLTSVDGWRAAQEDQPSRAEAVRQLVEAGLRVKSRDAVDFSDGEKMTIMMLCDLMKQLKIKGDTDPDFLQSVIVGGHYWALKWDLTGVFHGHVDKPEVVHEVGDILDMWTFIEHGYEKLSKKEKERVEKEVPFFGKNVAFPGFDGNYETSHMNIARFFVDEMDRFSKFKGRDLNSHSSTLRVYRQMYRLFEPMRKNLVPPNEMGADAIIRLLNVRMQVA